MTSFNVNIADEKSSLLDLNKKKKKKKEKGKEKEKKKEKGCLTRERDGEKFDSSFSIVWIIRSTCRALRSPANFSWPSRTGARRRDRERGREKRLEPMSMIDPETDWSQACGMQAVVCRSPVTSWRRSSIDLAERSVNKIIPAVQDLATTTTTTRRRSRSKKKVMCHSLKNRKIMRTRCLR